MTERAERWSHIWFARNRSNGWIATRIPTRQPSPPTIHPHTQSVRCVFVVVSAGDGIEWERADVLVYWDVFGIFSVPVSFFSLGEQISMHNLCVLSRSEYEQHSQQHSIIFPFRDCTPICFPHDTCLHLSSRVFCYYSRLISLLPHASLVYIRTKPAHFGKPAHHAALGITLRSTSQHQ